MTVPPMEGGGVAQSSFTLHQFCSPLGYAMYSRDEMMQVIRPLGIHIYTWAAKEQRQRCSGRQMCCLHTTYCLSCGAQPLSSSTPLAVGGGLQGGGITRGGGVPLTRGCKNRSPIVWYGWGSGPGGRR